MIKLTRDGELREPTLRAEMVDEIIRLRSAMSEALRQLRRYNRAEAEVIEILLKRRKDFAQPDVGDPSHDGGDHFYDNPANAGKDNV